MSVYVRWVSEVVAFFVSFSLLLGNVSEMAWPITFGITRFCRSNISTLLPDQFITIRLTLGLMFTAS